MTFPVLLLAALIIRFTPWRTGLPVDLPSYWARLLHAYEKGFPDWLLPLLLLFPLLPLGGLLWLLDGWIYGAAVLVLELLILLAALGRSDPLVGFGEHFEQAWNRGDLAAASLVAERETGAAPEDSQTLLQGMRGRLTWEACHAYFVPVFWFVLLGPLAALGYRLWWVSAHRPEARKLIASLVHAVEWVPLRLMALALALVGNFDPTLQRLRQLCLTWDVPSEPAISSCVEAALGSEPAQAPLAPARALVERAILAWAVAIAFIELAG